jgi:ABC-2 type transport system ATP-binding protein
MITVTNLSKRYRRTLAVHDLTFTVPPGRVTGFVGPNGAGKSTTLRMMLGLTRPTTGEVCFDGRAYRDLDRPLGRVGALLEGRSFHNGRRVIDHLRWLARSNAIPTARIAAVLGQVGLTEVARRRGRTLSLGLAQRLGLAAALLGDPPVLLLDEPVNGLDPEGIVWLRTLLRSLAAEGRTVLVSSHLMAEMALTADHVVVLHRGRLVADAPLTQLVASAGVSTLEEAFMRLTGAAVAP